MIRVSTHHPQTAPRFAHDVPCAECSHARTAHDHYRRGTDCGLCDCARYDDASAPRVMVGLVIALVVSLGCWGLIGALVWYAT